MGEVTEGWVEALRPAFLHCRDLGHSWGHYTAAYDAEARCYHRVLRCSSCETQRVQVLDSSGEVVKGWYRYPEGYLMPSEVERTGRIPRSTYRLADLIRTTTTRESR